MSGLSNPELIRWIACPACGGDVADCVESLKCRSCGAEYEIRNGIPLLYPPGMRMDHLREEQSLAGMMTSQALSPTEDFSRRQWQASKQEFWSVVAANLQAPPGLLIDIGCGYDSSVGQLERRGYTCVNFDMVHDMLDTLQRNAGARSCVAGDVNRLPFKQGTFDYVVSIDLLHHESNNVRALLEAFRDILRPGGMLFLEDPNAWGVFQMVKSMLLPRPLYRRLRSAYHRLRRSRHRPADYEFPTSVFRVRTELRRLGFQGLRVHPNRAYPCVGAVAFRVYALLSRVEFIRRYNNYHYIISGVRPSEVKVSAEGSSLPRA
jgi:SAM-dependent methyltransferase